MWAWQQLMVDGALANVSVHIAGGDEGASNIIANGIANLSLNHSSPFTLIVGGTSIAGLYSALSDSTLTQMVTLAQNDDPGTVFQLVASGLRTLPSNLSAAEPKPSILQALFETVWQTLSVAPSTINGQPVLQSDYGAHKTGSGGVSLTTAIPPYQKAFGTYSGCNPGFGSGLARGRRRRCFRRRRSSGGARDTATVAAAGIEHCAQELRADGRTSDAPARQDDRAEPAVKSLHFN